MDLVGGAPNLDHATRVSDGGQPYTVELPMGSLFLFSCIDVRTP